MSNLKVSGQAPQENQLIDCDGIKSYNVVKKESMKYLQSVIDWYSNDDSVFDLHFYGLKISLDNQTNSVVDRTYLKFD